MSATLTLGDTILTFQPEQPSVEELKSEIHRETLGGQRRVSRLWRKYLYRMTLEPLTVAAYNSFRDLWTSALSTGNFPTFSFAEWWPDANGVSVAMELGPHETPYGGPVGKTTLVLTEVNPR